MVYIHHIFLSHSSIDGHLGGFHVLAIVNSAAMNMWVHVSLLSRVLSRYMPKSGIAGSYGSSMYRFLRYLQTVLHSTFPPTVQEGSLFSTTPPALVCGLINDGHSDWCEVISRGSFDLHFSNNQALEHFFMCLLAICISSLEKCLFRSFAHFSGALLAFLLLNNTICSNVDGTRDSY